MPPRSLSSDDRLSCLQKISGVWGLAPRSREAPVPFLDRFLRESCGSKGKPQDRGLGLEGPVCHQPLCQELINGNRSEEGPTIKFSVYDCENRYRSAAS